MRRKNRGIGLILILLLFVGSYFLLQQSFDLFGSSKNESSSSIASYQEKANQLLKQNKEAERIAVPLLLQKNEKWQNVPYGISDGAGNLGENGCAILCLAMLDSYFSNTEVSPESVAAWAGENYYVAGAGTSWEIFSAYCQYKGWDFQNFGADMQGVQQSLQEGYPVIISVSAGTFTTSGHILLLTGYSEHGFYVNDPNDTAEKNHFFSTFSQETIQQETVNYWSIRG